MTVADLIAALEKQPPHLTVQIVYDSAVCNEDVTLVAQWFPEAYLTDDGRGPNCIGLFDAGSMSAALDDPEDQRVINNATTHDPDGPKGDGAALYSTSHPIILITDEMKEAGARVFDDNFAHRDKSTAGVVAAIYEAMVLASPPDLEIDDDALVTMKMPEATWQMHIDRYAKAMTDSMGYIWDEGGNEAMRAYYRGLARAVLEAMWGQCS
jgi:hypothetical protein